MQPGERKRDIDESSCDACRRRITEGQDRFIALACHELRSPLTSLTLEAQSLERLLASSETVRASSAARASQARVRAKCVALMRQVGRVTATVEQLLEVSRITSVGVELAPELLDLAQLVREVVTESQDVLRGSCSEVRFRRVGQAVGNWDRGALRNVVRQLLSNASKFGRGRPIDVEVLAPPGRAAVIVRDQGIGIAKENQDRIFERYERAVSERHYGGLGLGLWIAREVIAAHGGALRVRSVETVGSEFTVELPLGGARSQSRTPSGPPMYQPRFARVTAGAFVRRRRSAGRLPSSFGHRVDAESPGVVPRPGSAIAQMAGLFASLARVLLPICRRAWTAVG
jgi:signal transduction histidine kinase